MFAPKLDAKRGSPLDRVYPAIVSSVCVGVMMLVAYAAMGSAYEAISAAEGIRDARAGQVTTFHGGSLLVAWIGASVLASTRIDEISIPRRLFAAGLGMLVSSVVVGIALVMMAKTSTFDVTPPIALLISTPAGALGALMGWTRAR